MPGIDTFSDAITRFRNRSIHTYVGHAILFRGQVLQDGEFGVQSGWDTATNRFLMEHLIRLDFLRRKITHNPQETDIKNFVNQQRAKWLVDGGIEEEWDGYVAQLQQMGLDQMIEIYQNALDRYQGSAK